MDTRDGQGRGPDRTELDLDRYRHGAWQRIRDTVTEEISLTVAATDAATGREASAVLLAWPRDLETLAAGHALLELFPAEGAALRRVAVSVGNDRVYVVTVDGLPSFPPPAPPGELFAATLLAAMRAFIDAEGMWEETGCFHRAGVFDPQTRQLLVRAEDIGRHNCLDRLAGWSAVNTIPLDDKVLLTSARITGSMAAKALRAGFRILVGRSAVTTAAIAAANQARATLIGFARPNEGRFTVFADAPGRMPTLPDKP